MHGLQGIRNINAAHRERVQYHDPLTGQRDHHENRYSHENLVKLVHEYTQRLGLEHFQCNPSRLTVTFGSTT